MRHLAAYLLAALGSGAEPTPAAIEKILSSVGIESDSDKVQKVCSELKGKDLEDLIENGLQKLATVPSGGVAVAAGGAPAPSGGDAAPEAKKEEKKEESEESDDDMGFGLFD